MGIFMGLCRFQQIHRFFSLDENSYPYYVQMRLSFIEFSVSSFERPVNKPILRPPITLLTKQWWSLEAIRKVPPKSRLEAMVYG
jgi:hypothetical protein